MESLPMPIAGYDKYREITIQRESGGKMEGEVTL